MIASLPASPTYSAAGPVAPKAGQGQAGGDGAAAFELPRDPAAGASRSSAPQPASPLGSAHPSLTADAAMIASGETQPAETAVPEASAETTPADIGIADTAPVDLAAGEEASPNEREAPAAEGDAPSPMAAGATIASEPLAALLTPAAEPVPAEGGMGESPAMPAAAKDGEAPAAAARAEIAKALKGDGATGKGEGEARPELKAAAEAALNAPAPEQGAAAAPHARTPLPDPAAPAPPPPPLLPDAGRALPPAAVPIEIGLKALQGLSHFQISLEPAELGRVEVKLEIGEDKSVTARVVVDRVDTLGLLQRDARTLERAFEQAGLKPSDGGVEITLRDSGQQGRRDGEGDGRSPTPGPAASDTGESLPIEQSLALFRRAAHAGALDLTI